jgi:hypothetical protein
MQNVDLHAGRPVGANLYGQARIVICSACRSWYGLRKVAEASV